MNICRVKREDRICPCLCDKSLQLCPTLCDSMDCSPPGSSVREVLQARILEWVAISSSKDMSISKTKEELSN